MQLPDVSFRKVNASYKDLANNALLLFDEKTSVPFSLKDYSLK